MTTDNASETPSLPEPTEVTPETTESFGELLSEFNRTKKHRTEDGASQLQGTVVSISADSVFLDVGYKIEGALLRSAFPDNADAVSPGDTFPVSIKGRNEEGYYDLSLLRIAPVKDWTSLGEAFEQKATVTGRVTALNKGGFSVDIGVRAFMPASRSGVREPAEMEKLVGQEISCRIIKLDAADEDVVVDRRVIQEEQAQVLQQDRYAAVREGDILSGQVRSLTAYGAFVDLGGIDGLLHISDIAWSRVEKPEDILTVGQQLDVKVLKIEPATKRISLGLKQLQPEPWDSAAEKYFPGQRISGTVTRLMDFGAFIELEPGIEGLIHVSEMSWVKKVRKPSDMLKQGDTVEAVILSVAPAERRISLGLKQALGDPWTDVPQKFPAGSTIEGPVVRLTNFGAFVQLVEGVEGLIHVSEITAEKRINHPQEALRTGQAVKAQVMGIDTEKRQIKLSMKQLVPTGLDEYLAEHKVGDIVSGRILETTTVELGEGVRATCLPAKAGPAAVEAPTPAALDLSSLSSMLKDRWKGNSAPSAAKPAAARVGQIASFRIVSLDPDAKKIEVEPT